MTLLNSLHNPYVLKHFEEDFPMIVEKREQGLTQFYPAFNLATARLVLYIHETLSKSKEDYVTLNAEELVKLFKLRNNSPIYKAIKELIEVNVLQKKVKSQYWVNPLFINLKEDWKTTYRNYARDEHPSVYIKLYQ